MNHNVHNLVTAEQSIQQLPLVGIELSCLLATVLLSQPHFSFSCAILLTIFSSWLISFYYPHTPAFFLTLAFAMYKRVQPLNLSLYI